MLAGFHVHRDCEEFGTEIYHNISRIYFSDGIGNGVDISHHPVDLIPVVESLNLRWLIIQGFTEDGEFS